MIKLNTKLVNEAPLSSHTGAVCDKKNERLKKKLLHYTGKAIHDFKLIQPGDRIMVCVSGGKDSITLLLLLHHLQRVSKVPFEILSFTLDQGQPGWYDQRLRQFIEQSHIAYDIIKQDTYSIVKDKVPENKTYCGLCSRLRRGIIYRYARENGFNKIALGHHRDDLIQSLMMGICYNGEIRSMPPKLLTDDKSLVVIRPMVYVQESDIAAYAQMNEFPIIPCNLCGSQENLARQDMKQLIAEMAKRNPKVPSNMLRATQNVRKSQLMDKRLMDFQQLEAEQIITSQSVCTELANAESVSSTQKDSA